MNTYVTQRGSIETKSDKAKRGSAGAGARAVRGSVRGSVLGRNEFTRIGQTALALSAALSAAAVRGTIRMQRINTRQGACEHACACMENGWAMGDGHALVLSSVTHSVTAA